MLKRVSTILVMLRDRLTTIVRMVIRWATFTDAVEAIGKERVRQVVNKSETHVHATTTHWHTFRVFPFKRSTIHDNIHCVVGMTTVLIFHKDYTDAPQHSR